MMEAAEKYRVPPTHRVAVGAYVFDGEGRLLLLLRRKEPKVFAPPGGMLEPDEDPKEGILREVAEETGLRIRLLGPAFVWFGEITAGAPPFVGIDFIAEAETKDVRLSPEHAAFVWATPEDVEHGRVPTITPEGEGYDPKAIAEAFELWRKLTG